NEIKTDGSRHYSLEDYFTLYNPSYMNHNYYPVEYITTWTMDPLNMYNPFPTSTSTELWDNWNPPNYDPTQNTVDFNNGNFSSQVIPTIDIPEQPNDFDLTKGTAVWGGDLETISNYNLITTSSIIPENTHLWWEINTTNTIYAVDSADNTKLYKTTNRGNNWALVESRTKDIKSGSYDVDDGLIYFGDCDGSQFTAWYLDLTSDSITEVGSYSGTNLEFNSVWKVRGNIYVTVIEDSITKEYMWTGSDWVLYNTDSLYSIGEMTMAEWTLYALPGGENLPTWAVKAGPNSNIEIYYFTAVYQMFVWIHTLWGTTDMNLPSDKNLRKLVNLGDKEFGLILQNMTDQKYYYYISKNYGSDLSRYEMNVSLIQNGPTTGKAFHVSEYEVY
ncbi:hypothetical protein LCGC14_2895590, partial [marine sediment metagenome]